jgi:hypothetical protein
MSLHPLDRMPAVRRIDTNRPDAFAVQISGYVTAADVENLYGLLEGAYELHDRIDVLVRLVDYEGTDWAAVNRHTTEDGRNHAMQHVRRCAAVGEPDWTGRAGGFFSPELPVELKHFPLESEDEAWQWIGAAPED